MTLEASSDIFENTNMSNKVCQELWQTFPGKDMGTECACLEATNNLDVTTMECTSLCLFCSSDGAYCLGNKNYGTMYNARGDKVMEWESYQSGGVRHSQQRTNETWHLKYKRSGCNMIVNGTLTCNSCKYVQCSDGAKALSINCENLEPGAFFVGCPDDKIGTPLEDIVGTPLEGVFGDSFYDCLANLPPLSSPLAPPSHTPVLAPTQAPMTPFALTPIVARCAHHTNRCTHHKIMVTPTITPIVAPITPIVAPIRPTVMPFTQTMAPITQTGTLIPAPTRLQPEMRIAPITTADSNAPL
jgi:hypothetical protein